MVDIEQQSWLFCDKHIFWLQMLFKSMNMLSPGGGIFYADSDSMH